MKPWEWITAPENWLEWVMVTIAAEEEVRPILEQRRESEYKRKAEREQSRMNANINVPH